MPETYHCPRRMRQPLCVDGDSSDEEDRIFCVGGDSLEGEGEGEEEEEVSSRTWIARWPLPVNGADVGMLVLVLVPVLVAVDLV